jgi:hypothetical protein
MAEWVYPDSFDTVSEVANWIAVASSVSCLCLLFSWAALPVEKTNRHYLSICLTIGVLLMNLGFVIPLAAEPEQCYDRITPHSMQSNTLCGVSGSFIILGGWAGVMWAFLRSVSLHLQICWQVLIGRSFMIFAQLAGWGIPIIGLILALVFSGVSFRFSATCHINHANSLADFWIPLLIFAGATVIITFATFGYCIRVYLASLADQAESTEGSSLPQYTGSVQTITPRQAYRRIKRVISLQWRGIAIVLIIVADVIFFSVIFVFQDSIVVAATSGSDVAAGWALCLAMNGGNKEACLDEASGLVVDLATVSAVLFLLALNGIWLLFLLGRLSMITGWFELITKPFRPQKKEFVSVDARRDNGKTLAGPYEMIDSKELYRGPDDDVLSPIPPAVMSPQAGRRTPDYFGQPTQYQASAYHAPASEAVRYEQPVGETAQYHAPARSFSRTRPPQQSSENWDPQSTWAPSTVASREKNPLAMNRI